MKKLTDNQKVGLIMKLITFSAQDDIYEMLEECGKDALDGRRMDDTPTDNRDLIFEAARDGLIMINELSRELFENQQKETRH